MSLFRRKKTVKQAMLELIEHPNLGGFPLMQVDWLSEGEYVFQKGTYAEPALLAGRELYPHISRIYGGRRNLNDQEVINKKEVEALKTENAALKKTIEEQKEEIERLSHPQGRKILVDQKEPA